MKRAPGVYLMKLGKFRGQRIRDVAPMDLYRYTRSMALVRAKNRIALRGEIKKILEKIDAHLKEIGYYASLNKRGGKKQREKKLIVKVTDRNDWDR